MRIPNCLKVTKRRLNQVAVHHLYISHRTQYANNIVLRRVIYIHSLPGLKLVKRFSLANETWFAVTVPPFDFVKGDCVVGNDVLGKKGYKRSTEYKIYSRKSTNLTVVGLSCKTKGKNLS